MYELVDIQRQNSKCLQIFPIFHTSYDEVLGDIFGRLDPIVINPRNDLQLTYKVVLIHTEQLIV